MDNRRGLLMSVEGGSMNIDNYLTIVALENGLTASLSDNDVEYCIDGDGNWITLISDTASPTIDKDHYISFRGNLTPTSSVGVGTFTISKSCDLTGNCNSLLFGDEAVDNLDLTGKNYAFYKLFYGCTTIKNISSDFLPAITLANYCYEKMFYDCTSLTTAPELPATTLASQCYYDMFYSCRSLITAPQLPATTLASRCYYYMFSGCKSLTTAPTLPATTLASQCYCYMFYECTSLTTAPQLPATTLKDSCYYGMFKRCSSITTAPALPATTLASQCYYDMFGGTNVLPDCSNINFSSSTIVASGGLRGLFAGTKVTDSDLRNILPINSNGKYYLPCTTLASQCYEKMFYDCTSLTTAPELPATTLANYCYRYMFAYCTSITTAPALPATTLASRCYYYMFYKCPELNYIKAMFTTTPSSSYTDSWVYGVASSGIFVKNKDATWDVTGVDGIPSGWTVQTA